ncbi:uncharacterized protein LOC141911508 isoform X2 [Tubulanus polymorphus]|uniref:uncharacterized protein LOC141911508 isoform X2 n=1 Tax=Tubulanus polymorphus TaxID=672921 RepID=UPI003DA3B1F0
METKAKARIKKAKAPPRPSSLVLENGRVAILAPTADEADDTQIQIQVVLPSGDVQKHIVDKKVPVMDLFVQLAAANKISPSNHMISAIDGAGKSIEFRPNQTIESLKTNKIFIEPKMSSRDKERLKKQRLDSTQQFELTHRLIIGLPGDKQMVLRVSLQSKLADVFRSICDEKDLVPQFHEVRHPQTLETLDMEKTLKYYNITELVVVNNGVTNSGTSIKEETYDVTSQSELPIIEQYVPPPKMDAPSKKKRGFFNFGRSKTKNGSAKKKHGISAPSSPAISHARHSYQTPSTPVISAAQPQKPQAEVKPQPKLMKTSSVEGALPSKMQVKKKDSSSGKKKKSAPAPPNRQMKAKSMSNLDDSEADEGIEEFYHKDIHNASTLESSRVLPQPTEKAASVEVLTAESTPALQAGVRSSTGSLRAGADALVNGGRGHARQSSLNSGSTTSDLHGSVSPDRLSINSASPSTTSRKKRRAPTPPQSAEKQQQPSSPRPTLPPPPLPEFNYDKQQNTEHETIRPCEFVAPPPPQSPPPDDVPRVISPNMVSTGVEVSDNNGRAPPSGSEVGYSHVDEPPPDYSDDDDDDSDGIEDGSTDETLRYPQTVAVETADIQIERQDRVDAALPAYLTEVKVTKSRTKFDAVDADDETNDEIDEVNSAFEDVIAEAENLLLNNDASRTASNISADTLEPDYEPTTEMGKFVKQMSFEMSSPPSDRGQHETESDDDEIHSHYSDTGSLTIIKQVDSRHGDINGNVEPPESAAMLRRKSSVIIDDSIYDTADLPAPPVTSGSFIEVGQTEFPPPPEFVTDGFEMPADNDGWIEIPGGEDDDHDDETFDADVRFRPVVAADEADVEIHEKNLKTTRIRIDSQRLVSVTPEPIPVGETPVVADSSSSYDAVDADIRLEIEISAEASPGNSPVVSTEVGSALLGKTADAAADEDDRRNPESEVVQYFEEEVVYHDTIPDYLMPSYLAAQQARARQESPAVETTPTPPPTPPIVKSESYSTRTVVTEKPPVAPPSMQSVKSELEEKLKSKLNSNRKVPAAPKPATTAALEFRPRNESETDIVMEDKSISQINMPARRTENYVASAAMKKSEDVENVKLREKKSIAADSVMVQKAPRVASLEADDNVVLKETAKSASPLLVAKRNSGNTESATVERNVHRTSSQTEGYRASTFALEAPEAKDKQLKSQFSELRDKFANLQKQFQSNQDFLLRRPAAASGSVTADAGTFKKPPLGRVIDTPPSERPPSFVPPPPPVAAAAPARQPATTSVKLEPREELMLSIRGVGGRQALRPVSIGETRWSTLNYQYPSAMDKNGS